VIAHHYHQAERILKNHNKSWTSLQNWAKKLLLALKPHILKQLKTTTKSKGDNVSMTAYGKKGAYIKSKGRRKRGRTIECLFMPGHLHLPPKRLTVYHDLRLLIMLNSTTCSTSRSPAGRTHMSKNCQVKWYIRHQILTPEKLIKRRIKQWIKIEMSSFCTC